MIRFSTPPCQPRSKSKIKTIGHTIAKDALIISCNFHVSRSLTYPKTLGKEPKWLIILRTIFLKFEPSFLSTSVRKEKKAIELAITSDTLIISCYFNINHFLTCPKTWGKGPKRLQIPFFISLSTPTCWPRSQSK